MKSVKQNCFWAGGTFPFAKQSNWKIHQEGISVTYDIGLLGNIDVTVPFTEFGNAFFLEPVESMYN